MTPLARNRLTLFTIVVLVTALVMYLEREVSEPKTASVQNSGTAAPVAAAIVANKTDGGEIVDIFAVRTWAPPPPPVVIQAPPPPQAPPLPFRLLGQIEDGPEGRAFVLAQGDRVINVAPGTTIDERYRLEKFEGGQLHFLYLPLNLRQTLAVGNPL